MFVRPGPVDRLDLGAVAGELRGSFGDLCAFIREAPLLFLETPEHRIEFHGVLGDQVPGSREQISREAEPRRNRQRIAPAGAADLQPVGRRQRLRFELHGSVQHAFGSLREHLERVMVRRHDDPAAPGDELVQQGDAQRGPLGWVRTRAEFIEQDQRLGWAVCQELRDMA